MSEPIFTNAELFVFCLFSFVLGLFVMRRMHVEAFRKRQNLSKTRAELKPQPARLWAVYIASQQRPDGRI